MSAKYLIRLDDACETMEHENWNLLENIFNKLNIKPIVAVIPNNKDKNFFLSRKDKKFWKRVKFWDKKGWTIAIHGYQHVYHAAKKNKMILPFYNSSEFAGLKQSEQMNLLIKAYNIFIKKKIYPKIWIAPRHTFDKYTLSALEKMTPIRIISDGIAFNPYKVKNFIFIPQQLWWPEKKRFGIWTICLHPNSMDKNQIIKLGNILSAEEFNKKITSVESVINQVKPANIFDKIYFITFFLKRKIKYFFLN
jgi:predicted deacetylase